MAAAAILPLRAVAADTAVSTLDAPPAGLQPAQVRLAEVLAAHRAAVGVRSPGIQNSVVEHWTFVDSGFAGTEDLQRSGTDYHSRIVQGPFSDEYGQYGQTRWHQDANGFASLSTVIDTESFYATRVLEDADDPKNDASIIGQTGGAAPAYVVEVKVAGRRHPEFVYYDKSSAQIVRVESASGKRRLVQTFGDFRRTDGISRAWHIHDTDGRPSLDDDWVLQSLQYGAAIPSETFQMPANRPTISRATTVTPLPASKLAIYATLLGMSGKMFGGFLVRMQVAGRGLDFLLDSSTSHSIIDNGVAAQLGLPTYGQVTRLPDGRPVSYRTMLPHATIGAISLDNFALDSEEFAYDPNSATKVVGILGYDFFAANILHFDFLKGTLEALPIGDFAQVHPVKDGIDVPLSLDDGLPLVTLGIGNAVAEHSLLSTSMPFSILLGAFVAAHPEEVHDASGKAHGTSVLPFADEGSYGTKVQHWTSEISNFRFAILDYQRVGVETTNAPLVVKDQSLDALLGADYLHYYDLYFVYPYGRLIVKPNAIFFSTFKKDS